jgi:hypothetical protein
MSKIHTEEQFETTIESQGKRVGKRVDPRI